MKYVIEFEDIRVGDKIRSTYTFANDSIAINETREGVVTLIKEDCVYAGAGLLAVPSPHTTYELIERPKPEVPTEYLSVVQHKIFGDAFKLVKVDNTDASWLGRTIESDGHWHTNKSVQALLDSGDWEVVTNEDHR